MELKPGEMICPKCSGQGAILHGKLELMDYVCPKCKGRKVIDWVQNIMGVPGTTISPGVYVKEVDCSLFIIPEGKE